MEKLSGVWDNVKERLNNPLIFSFIISWVFFNWQIPVALLWYDSPGNTEDNLSLIDFIEQNLSTANSFWYPLAFAITYTLSIPILKNLISAFQSWNLKWGDRLTLMILKNSVVPIDKYLKLRRNYEKRTEVLEQIITTENVRQEQLDLANTKLLTSEGQQNELQKQLNVANNKINSFTSIKILQGQWQRVIKRNGETKRENIEISNNNVFAFNGNMREQRYSIHNFFFDPTSKNVTFSLFHITSNPQYNFFSFNQLTYRHGDFVGIEYGTEFQVDIEYIGEDQDEEMLDIDTEEQEVADRDYWLRRATHSTMTIPDEILKIINQKVAPGFNLKYNRYYIGLENGGIVNNFVVFRPKKDYTRVEIKLPQAEPIDRLLEDAGIEQMEYKDASERYRLRLKKGDPDRYSETIFKLLSLSFKYH